MRISLSIFVMLVFAIQYSFAQVVKTIPVLPTESDSIIVYFDATQPGAEGLLNYPGTVYAHTGVTTNLGQWIYVIGKWGFNATQPSLTRLDTNLYKLTIGYPRKFYGVTDTSEKITALDLVFRSSDGSKQTSPDIFVPLYPSGLNVKVISPAAPFFANLNDSVRVEVASAGAKSVSLYINNLFTTQTTNRDTTFKIKATNYGDTWIKAVAVDSNNNSIADSSYFVVNPNITFQDEPTGIVDGINYKSNSSVILSLYAPHKKNVYVIGDFDNWVVDQKYYMKETPDSSRWWIEIDGLTSQKEYIFQYLVDGTIRIADPYSEKISDPDNDKFISDSTYPNLIQYPYGKTTQIASVLETGQTPYQWHDSSFVPPAKTNLVIYELLIRDFLATHDYKTLADTLSYFKRLGINAIELMPIMNFEGNISWGYNPNFFDAPAKYYGPKDDLKRFIDMAHQDSIAVILDIPFNDAFGSCPLVRLYWDPINNVPAANNPWFNQYPTHPYNVGYDFNHTSAATHYFVDATTKFWLTQYHADGFRFDLAGGYTQAPNGYNEWQNYDASRIVNEQRIADAMWKVKPNAYVILEEFVDPNEEQVVVDSGMMVWDNMSSAYEQAAMGWANPSWDLSGISYKQLGWTVPGLVGYMESHDQERLMYQNLKYGNSSGSYNIKDTSTALNRIKLCDAFFYTIPGPKMLWEFQELGYDYSINYNGRTGNKPIRWDYYNDPERLSLYKTTAAFIHMKTEIPAFKSNGYIPSLSGAVKQITIYDNSTSVTVIGNFDVVSHTATPFTSNEKWYDYFTGSPLSATSSTTLNLAPGEFHIYTTTQYPVPDTSVVTGIMDNHSNQIKTFELGQNYPNPFNPSTIIKYQLPKSGLVNLKIYDVLGREIETLVNKEEPAGSYTVQFNSTAKGISLPSGIYFYRLQSGSNIETKKMILMK
ncbi:MAG: alpha-amylase family glycosyl hydrolase [Ignavibacteriaceae bacterium]